MQLGQLNPGNYALPGFGKGDSGFGEGDSGFGKGDSGFCGESLAAGFFLFVSIMEAVKIVLNQNAKLICLI